MLSEKPPQTVCVVLMHPFDPRGRKVGGVETFLRDYIALHPKDLHILLIGVDECGDLSLGVKHDLSVFGRNIEFIPVIRVLENETSKYASSLTQSLTLRFLLATLRIVPKFRRYLKRNKFSADLRRSEFALLATAFGIPSVQMLHDGMSKDKMMSSLLKKHWWIKEVTEGYALRRSSAFYCVNSDLTLRLKERFPKQTHKLDTLTTWANPATFQPTPFRFDGDHIDVMYAGRMDLFKRPDLMFSVIAELQRLTGRVRFHYVGDGDPEQFPEFAAIRDITVREGVMKGPQIAELMQRCQMGLLTSDFEGMPRFIMELLTSGRPAVCLHLPQLEAVVHDGRTGFLIPRGPDQVAEQARRMLETYELARTGRLDPAIIRQAVEPFSPKSLLGKLWNDHRRLRGVAV